MRERRRKEGQREARDGERKNGRGENDTPSMREKEEGGAERSKGC